MGLTGWIQKLSSITPVSIVRGIQIALGILLAVEGLKLVATNWVWGVIAILVVIILRNNKYAPAAIVLMVTGIIIVFAQHNFPSNFHFSITLPPLTWFSPAEIWKGMVLAGFAQIALSATNAVIATSALISEYFPDKPVSERKLAFNMGVMNVAVPFFGGMPM
ncbi:MAG: hypothetical protein NTV30_00590, partial [Chloroflexi bacterium]|nr:hypothetical protein [Chloroflexota bacterium]